MSRAKRVFPEVDRIADIVFERSAVAEARVNADEKARIRAVCSDPFKLAAVARAVRTFKRRRKVGLSPTV
tara:strand:- start:369 stop:578 length:210 start_codon:yes stop_codon:yes gene_type:complete